MHIRARLIGIPPDQHPAVNDVLVSQGRFLTSQEPRTILVESHFAHAHDLAPGAILAPFIDGQKVPFTVAGIAASPEYLIVSASKQDIVPSPDTFAVLFVSLPEPQSLTGSGDSVNDIDILLVPGANREAVVKTVQEKLAPYGLLATTLQADQPSNAALQLDLEGYREIADLMPALILMVAAGSVYIMLGRQVHSQRPQIGLMKALGYSDRAVMGQYLSAALAIAVAGAIAGLAVGLPLAYLITKAYAAELGIPLVETKFYPDVAVSGVVLSLVFAALAGIGPARGAARMAPAIAMRLDPAVALVSGRMSPIERALKLPMWLRLPVRNVFRVRRRSLTTAVGIVFAFVLILAGLGMLDSINYILSMAKKFNLHAGDAITVDTPLGTHSLTLSATSDDLMSAAGYVSLEKAQGWMGTAQQVFNSVYLTVTPGQVNSIESSLYSLPGASGVLLKADSERAWQSLMGLFYVFMGVILLFAVAMAFAVLFNATTVNVTERLREFGTMRAIGTAQSQIALFVTVESILLWAITLIPGLLAGTWVAQQMGAAFSSDLFAFSIVINPTSYIFTSLGILLTMLGAALPAIRRVNRLNLAEATKVLT